MHMQENHPGQSCYLELVCTGTLYDGRHRRATKADRLTTSRERLRTGSACCYHCERCRRTPASLPFTKRSTFDVARLAESRVNVKRLSLHCSGESGGSDGVSRE